MKYDFQCVRCQFVFEKEIRIQHVVKGKHLNVHCPNCRGHARKLINKPAVHFKGEGFTLSKGEK